MILWPYLYEISLSKPLGHESNAARALSSLGASDLLFHTVRTEYGHQRPLSFQDCCSTLFKMGPLTTTCSSYCSYLSPLTLFYLFICAHTSSVQRPHLMGGIPFPSSQKVLDSTDLDCVQYQGQCALSCEACAQLAKLTSWPPA